MEFDGRHTLVTGANRGLGRHFAAQLRDRGAIVYAAARNPDQIDLPGVTPIQLDITDAASVRRAGEQIAQLAVLINNAGSSNRASLLTGDLGAIRNEMDTHFFGTLELTRAVAPQLRAAAPAAVLNVLSVLSWFSMPDSGAYSAAKSAEWSLTNALRQEFAPDGIRVSALHVGYMDTDMTKGIDGPKSDPGEIAKLALDGVAASVAEIVADDVSRGALAALSGGVAALYPSVA